MTPFATIPTRENERLIMRGIREDDHAALSFIYFDLGWKTAMSCIDRDHLTSQTASQRMDAVKEQTDVSFDDYTVDIWRHLPSQTFKELH